MAENFCVGFHIMNRGKIIGGPTMGSSGTPLSFTLPGGGTAQVVTTRSSYPDGKEFIGTGVKPDIEVYPKIEDFRTGRDRILEKALEYLNKNVSL
jgi:C-terminal processing protease CtpA/Prc